MSAKEGIVMKNYTVRIAGEFGPMLDRYVAEAVFEASSERDALILAAIRFDCREAEDVSVRPI